MRDYDRDRGEAALQLFIKQERIRAQRTGFRSPALSALLKAERELSDNITSQTHRDAVRAAEISLWEAAQK